MAHSALCFEIKNNRHKGLIHLWVLHASLTLLTKVWSPLIWKLLIDQFTKALCATCYNSWKISSLNLLHITCLLDVKLTFINATCTNLWGLGVSVKTFQELIKGSRWLAKTIKAKTNQSMIQSRSTYCFVIWSTINQVILLIKNSLSQSQMLKQVQVRVLN